MRKFLCLLLCFTFSLSMIACNEKQNENKSEDESNNNVVAYTFDYDLFLGKIEQVIGPEEMFTSMEKISTHKSYDNYYTDLFALTSMMFEREYMMSIIYEENSIKSIEILGERSIISADLYSLSTDYIILASVVYQILNEQTDAYGIMVSDFNMTSQETQIMKTKTSDNWIMVYSANNENVSFLFQTK